MAATPATPASTSRRWTKAEDDMLMEAVKMHQVGWKNLFFSFLFLFFLKKLLDGNGGVVSFWWSYDDVGVLRYSFCLRFNNSYISHLALLLAGCI